MITAKRFGTFGVTMNELMIIPTLLTMQKKSPKIVNWFETNVKTLIFERANINISATRKNFWFFVIEGI